MYKRSLRHLNTLGSPQSKHLGLSFFWNRFQSSPVVAFMDTLVFPLNILLLTFDWLIQFFPHYIHSYTAGYFRITEFVCLRVCVVVRNYCLRNYLLDGKQQMWSDWAGVMSYVFITTAEIKWMWQIFHYQ